VVVLAHHFAVDQMVFVAQDPLLPNLLDDGLFLSRDEGVHHVTHQVKGDGASGGEIEAEPADLETFAGDVVAGGRHSVAVVFRAGSHKLVDVGVVAVGLELVRHVAQEGAGGHLICVARTRDVYDGVRKNSKLY